MNVFFISSKKSLKVIITFFVFFFLFCGCKIYTALKDITALQQEQFVSEEKGKPRLEYINSIPIIHLYGSPYEMGFQYGTLLKNQLNSLVELTSEVFPKRKLNEYLAIGRKISPNLFPKMADELMGISEASGVNIEGLYAINLVPRTSCSTFAVWGDATVDRNLIMGRNADYPFKAVNKALGLIVVKHPSEGYATVMVTFLGMIGGYSGMNETGLCYGNMLVHNSNEKETNYRGLSIQLLMQYGGEQFSQAKEMANFISKQQHLTPINVMFADKEEAFVLEASQTNAFLREGQKGVLAATNSFLSPSLHKEYFPCERYAKLMLHAKENYGNYTVDKVKEAMHVARQPNKNLQCVIFEPSTKTLHVSINRVPASKGPFTLFKLDELFMN